MERNRIQEFLVERTAAEHATRLGRLDASSAHAEPVAEPSLVAIPHALWSELHGDERAQYMSIYRQAFLQADAQIRRECAERLLESITPR